MARRLPRLRSNLDLMPSPVADRPGVMIRDPFRYSDATLIIPPPLVECLPLFDGERTELDLRAALVAITGDLRVGDLVEHLVRTLSEAGFLEDEVYAEMERRRHRAFQEASVREAAHAGSAYPAEPELLRATLARCLDGAVPWREPALGVAAPHVSPEGGWQCYRDAYACLDPAARDVTFLVLGTSHFGLPDRFGLTRKPYRTPLGQTTPCPELTDWLAERAPEAVTVEDYCHAVEHSIEFQVLFLQHRYGPDVRVLPILCGSFHCAGGLLPEQNAAVARFLEALRELAEREGERLRWVLGVDLAHMGRRYGDRFAARARQGRMRAVEEEDRRRLERVEAGDAEGFWRLVKGEQDGLKWCGASALYAFLRAVPQVRGQVLRYEQWNIDEQSVVSFAAVVFTRPRGDQFPEGCAAIQ
ncbi:MAG: AmmeMemoRadiSam system protein B [Bryobacterales bacterium]|nr:AmmeMemoRadiSam system protein B [Bryobacteraceae bacterium]MDW8130446.1 AmmeMemoRadiSam system protein B [Bryobacterales bacterium]